MHEFSDHKQAKFAVAITSHRKHRELLQSVLKETIIYKAGETDMTRFLLAKDYENPNESDQKTTPNHMMLILLREQVFPLFASVPHLFPNQIHRYY